MRVALLSVPRVIGFYLGWLFLSECKRVTNQPNPSEMPTKVSVFWLAFPVLSGVKRVTILRIHIQARLHWGRRDAGG